MTCESHTELGHVQKSHTRPINSLELVHTQIVIAKIQKTYAQPNFLSHDALRRLLNLKSTLHRMSRKTKQKQNGNRFSTWRRMSPGSMWACKLRAYKFLVGVILHFMGFYWIAQLVAACEPSLLDSPKDVSQKKKDSPKDKEPSCESHMSCCLAPPLRNPTFSQTVTLHAGPVCQRVRSAFRAIVPNAVT